MNKDSQIKNENYEILGYLKDLDDIVVDNFKSSYIRLLTLTDVPDDVRNIPFKNKIRLYINEIDELEKIDNSDYTNYAKKKYISDYLSDKLIIMHPRVKEGDGGKIHYIGKALSIINTKSDFNIDDKLIPSIIFDKDNLSNQINNVDDFVHALEQRQFLMNIDNYWPTSDLDYPSIIVFKDYDYSYLFFGVKNQGFDSYKKIALSMKNFRSYKKNNYWIKKQYHYKNIMYLPISVVDCLKNESQDINFWTNNSDNIISNIYENKKDKIINRFNIFINEKYNLTYSYNDIINFHNSIKSNLLTILTGLSGTGKSKIVTAYADALGIKNNPIQFNMVSVRPFWQDDSDLLGFVDTINNNYHPGDSGVVDTIIDANKNPNQIYIIVFDEMNLARVEYYFSQFLSVLEKDPKDRLLRLYNKKIQPRLYNGDKYPSSISIPENIRFVGTMNVDETTFQISDKVLDRSNVITLKSVPFVERNVNKDINYNVSNNNEIKYNEFEEEIHNNNYSFNQRELKFFDDLNYCIKRYLPNVGIGWRNLNSIEKFISNISFYEYDNFDVSNALDYQISQRILPKIRGTKMMLDDLLNKENNNYSSIFKVLDDYKDLSNFELTRELLGKKLRESKVIGFAN